MYKRYKLMLSLISFAISLALMTFSVFAATSHTLGVENNISFDIEDNICFNLTAAAYHGNYTNEVLTIVSDYTGRIDKPTSFNNGQKLNVRIDEQENEILSQGWNPFTETSGVVTIGENSLIWDFIFENTGENNLKAEVLFNDSFWGEEIGSSSKYSLTTTYQLGNNDLEFGSASNSVLKTTTTNKFLKVRVVFTVTEYSTNISGEDLNFTIRISEENVVFSDVSMMTFSQSASSCTLTAFNLDENVNTVIIPKTYNGLPVTKIQSTSTTGILSGNEVVTEIVLPETLVEISNSNQKTVGSGVFENCSKLETINLDNVTTLSANLFYGCTDLKNISLSDEVTYIPDNCFYGCTNLKTINLNNITSTGSKSFRGCESLTSINISNIQTIGSQTFRDCKNLQEIILPNTEYNIGQGAFYECDSIISIDLSNGNITSSYSFFQCDGLKNVVLNSSQTTIYENSFYKCINLLSINLQNVTNFQKGCFAYCQNLDTFDGNNNCGELIFNNSLANIGQDSFRNCTKLQKITLPSRTSDLTLGINCFRNAGISGELTLPNHYLLGNVNYVKASNTSEIIEAGQFTGCPITSFILSDSNNYYTTDGSAIYTLASSSYNGVYLIAYASASNNTSYEVKATTQNIRYNEFENAINLTTLTVNSASAYLQASSNIIYKKGTSQVIAKLN